jgi:hypothetical protein
MIVANIEFYHNNTCLRLLQILFSAICAGRIRSSACNKYYSNDVIILFGQVNNIGRRTFYQSIRSLQAFKQVSE